MFELDRRRKKTHAKKLNGGTFQVLHTNGKHCIVQDVLGGLWMSVPVATGVDLYPMRND